jgi:virginiamycin B lyase
MVRPITLNLIGYTLSRELSRAPSLDAARLVERHIDRALSQDAIRAFTVPVLLQLISNAATKLQRTETEIAARAKLRPLEVRLTLGGLAAEGLVRPLDPSHATWEISHDFLAHALARRIARRRHNPLRYAAVGAVPIVAAGAFAASYALCIDCPREFIMPTIGARPWGIAAGGDGNIWVSEFAAGKIARISPSGAITEFPVPSVVSNVPILVPGPDGALWFTENGANKIGRIGLDGSIEEFPTPTKNSGPQDIVAGPDGALWYTEYAGVVARITTSGASVEYKLPAGSDPGSIATGPDGMIWFIDNLKHTITRMSTSGRIVRIFKSPGQGFPNDIVAGPDGALWFTESQAGRIGRITPSGGFKEFRVPGSGAFQAITRAQGAIWLVHTSEIDRMNVLGEVTYRYHLRRALAENAAIAQGPDGGIWFTDSAANAAVRLP